MYLRQFEYVLVVAEECSFSKAAKRLYITQPSLSQNIQSVETQLGIQLFERANKSLKLTYAGDLFVKTARNIIALQKQLQQQICDINDSTKGRLNIGISLVRGSLLLPQILPVFHERFPGIELSIQEGTSSELENYIERGNIDLAILTLPIKNQNFHYETLLTENVLVAVPPQHPLGRERVLSQTKKKKGYPTISFNDIQREPFILLRSGSRLRQTIDSLFHKNSSKPNILLECNSIVTINHLVAAGMGLTFIGESVARFTSMPKPPVYFTLDGFNLNRTMVATYRKDLYLTKAAREFITIIKEVVNLATGL